jgi:NhaP-type Na+/H+ or K+/H+ antiporter
MDVLLNFGGFMYIGAIMPWDQFHTPEVTGITLARLMGLGFLVLILRRIPAVFAIYKLMPDVVVDWKEALFMGYFGPIGAGAVFYVEHTRHLFPELGEGDEEETNLVRAMIPCVYFLVIFSIVVHGLSIPALDLLYRLIKVEPVQEDAVEIRRKSMTVATPTNAMVGDEQTFIAYNRFSRPVFNVADIPTTVSKRQSLATEKKYGQSVSRIRIMEAAREGGGSAGKAYV